MFDTEKFIMEIQSRESIWNTSSAEYTDRGNRRKAWEEVAAVMFSEFNNIRSKKRNELVLELQKKWKHLRDYFVREKNKELQQKVVAPKKRRAPFLDLLNEFMHVSKTPGSPIRPPPIYRQSHQTSPISLEETEDANFKNDFIHVHRDKHTPKKHHETHSRINNQMKSNLDNETHRTPNNQIQSNLDPNMVFLLSILPEMQTMDERQTFEFKLEVMNLIKNIKYNDPNYYNRPAGTSSNDYQQPYYMFGNQHYEVPPNGSNSPVSEHSEGDQSFLPQEICLIEKEEIQEDISAEEEKII